MTGGDNKSAGIWNGRDMLHERPNEKKKKKKKKSFERESARRDTAYQKSLASGQLFFAVVRGNAQRARRMTS